MTIPYVPIDERGWRMSMGLRPLEISRWIEIDEHREADLAQKADLLENQYDAVVATRPAGDAPSAELLRELDEWLGTYAPGVVRTVTAEEHPVVVAARWVQEDLCVLVRDDTWRLQAACVCFPSRWRLADKIGRTLDQIHAPVPGYGEKLSGPTTGAFDRLGDGRSYWRLNWTVLDDPGLHQPGAARQLVPAHVDQWYFRVERQTIRRLPETGAIVFTIRNYVTSVRDLCATPEFSEQLTRGIDSAPVRMKEYKGWLGVAERLRELLG